MAEIKTDSSYLETMLSLVDVSKLTTEQVEQHNIILASIKDAKETERVKALLVTLNDQLMINAKLVQDDLNLIDIPESINTIKLPFSYNAEKETFFPASDDHFPIDAGFPLITRVDRHLVSSLDNQTKPVKEAMTTILNEAGQKAYKIDNFVEVVKQQTAWLSGAHADITGINIAATGLGLMSDIDIQNVKDLESTSGSVVFSYNSQARLKKSNPEIDYKSGTFHITSCGFGKKTKYTPKSGNGTKTKASEWIPDGYKATTIKGYVVERFSDDEKIAALITAGTDYNANQHLLRMEKALPESDRAYTNFKKSQ